MKTARWVGWRGGGVGAEMSVIDNEDFRPCGFRVPAFGGGGGEKRVARVGFGREGGRS